MHEAVDFFPLWEMYAPASQDVLSIKEIAKTGTQCVSLVEGHGLVDMKFQASRLSSLRLALLH